MALGPTNGLRVIMEQPGRASDDVARWLPGLDVLVLSSAWGGGLPNVLGEATACAVPCAATDVGDSAWIIGPCGSMVPRRDPEALARMLDRDAEQRHQLGQAARARTIELLSLHRVAQQDEALYEREPDGIAGATQGDPG